MTLRPEQREELLEALLSAFPDHASLNALVLLKFGHPLDQVAMGHDLRIIALKLITWAEARSRLEVLIEGAVAQSPDNLKLKAFSSLHQPVFFLRERESLIELARAGGFSNEELLRCFRRSWPARAGAGLPEVREEELLHQLVEELRDVPEQEDGSLPLLHFAALLKVQARTTITAERLERWIAEAAARRGRRLADILQRAQRETAPAARALFLLMRIDTASEGRCSVQAWVSQGADGPMLSIHADDTPRELRTVAELLSDLRRKLTAQLIAAGNQLVIEVMLPHESLSHAVERWSLAQGKHLVACGCKFPVVVRSWERVYDPDRITVRPDWKQKWNRLSALPSAAHPRAVVWEPEPHAVAELFDRLSLDGVVCMALMHAQEGNAEASSDALAACIDSGTPVAVWGRKWSADLQERREQIARLLADIRRLPEQVRDLRAAARGGGEEHPGHSLVLLWDDPNRLPPDALPVTQLVLPAP